MHDELMRSLAIVSVDSRDLSTSIQYLVRYAGSKAEKDPALAPLTFAKYPLASAMSAWTKAVYCERHGCTFKLFWASANSSAFNPWVQSQAAAKPRPRNSKLNSAWLKPLTIHHVLSTTKFEFVLFLDGDVLLTRFDVSLAPLLRDMRAQRRNLALGLPNVQGHNAGVILVRRAPETLTLVREWWETHAQPKWWRYSTKVFFEQTTLNFAILAQKRYMSTLCESDLLTGGELNASLQRLLQGRDLTQGHGDHEMSDAWRTTHRMYAKRCMYGVDPTIGPVLYHLSTGQTKHRVRADHAAARRATSPAETSNTDPLLQGAVRAGTQTVLVLEKMMHALVKSDWLVSGAAAAETIPPLKWRPVSGATASETIKGGQSPFGT